VEQREGTTASSDAVAPDGKVFSFGPFQLLTAKRLLLENGQRVALGGRALDILIALVSRAGKVISNEELLAQAWAGIVVEPGTLRVHILSLRRALGDGNGGRRFIVNSHGRGYSFVAPVSELIVEPEAPPADSTIDRVDNLPRLVTPVFGRVAAIDTLTDLLLQRRFITIVGPAGIGKTTVALTLASHLHSNYSAGVRFLDLAPISDPRLVPSALAALLGQAVTSNDPIPSLVAVLRPKALLLVIDNCEHVIEIAARLAEEICKGAPGVHILATSREPLRARGEHVHRLKALEAPSASSVLTAADALAFPAVQLFADRATAALDSFTLSDANAPVVAEICRRLDGIALAIELAAGRVDTFGVHGVAARLDDRFQLLAQGHRTAPPRHHTLDAAFDWSFQLLTESTRLVFQRLSIFAGDFSIDAATEIATDDRITPAGIAEQLATLVSTSLVSVDITTETASYRLLDSARAYARKKLIEQGGLGAVAKRHAEYFRDVFKRAEVLAARSPAAGWQKAYAQQLENLRVALDWASLDSGDRRLAVELTIAGVPIWMRLSLSEECRSRVEAALQMLDPTQLERSSEAMQLFSALGSSLTYRFDPRSSIAWTKALGIARTIGDTENQLRAIRGLWTNKYADGDIDQCENLAREFCHIALKSSDPADLPVGQRLTGMVHYYRGDMRLAQEALEGALAAQTALENEVHLMRYRLDPRSVTGTVLAQVLWFSGFPDRAWELAEDVLARAKESEHALTILDALAYSHCKIAIFNGNFDAAGVAIAELSSRAVLDPQGPYETFAQAWSGVLLNRQGDFLGAIQKLTAALQAVPEGSFLLPHTWFCGELAFALGKAGEIERANKAISQAIEICKLRAEHWCLSELLRIRGETILLTSVAGANRAAEDEFQRAMTVAREQGALSWELRSAISSARLKIAEGAGPSAKATLEPVMRRFSEGFDTLDFREASTLAQGIS